ncbi:hypothetical protein JM16_005333 [Phytophthora kernoviae]|uniref:Tudor domain-containing protein n=1 Tax=Phytophthora kernoviae TaxID=325452 RepID=A0A8T0LZ42_9STRA|nr:hypothetical protein JM16_005333 [Phytophthora kernoviae]
MVAARRSILQNSGIELGDIFVQYDAHRTGFVPRSTFVTLLRDYSIPLPETTVHFLMIQAIPLGERDYEIGVIARVRPNGTYDIEFDSGLYEKNVEGDCILEISRARVIRARNVSDEEKEEKKAPKPKDSAEDGDLRYEPGDRIEARFRGSDRFFAGTVKKYCAGGLYDIEYDDGEVELRVRAKYIKQLKSKTVNVRATNSSVLAKATTTRYNADTDDAPKAKKFKEGEKVEAQYKGKSKFYLGVISRCRLNGTYDIDYDDGEKETGVAAELIRSVGKKTADSDDAPKAKKFKEGEKVEAQYKGKSKFYLGVISRCRLNGTYDIDYDDGEKETGVAAELIRSVGKKTADSDDAPKAKKFKEGEKVEAQYKGKSKFYLGVISRCRLNGTYDIDYDDGEKETGVAAELIRSVGKKTADSDDAPKAKKFKEGEKVEAQYKGKSKFYLGVISRCRLNGTYDIDYDDGEKETGVAAELIRSVESSSKPKRMADISPRMGESKSLKTEPGQTFRIGARVEARYMGKDAYFKAG